MYACKNSLKIFLAALLLPLLLSCGGQKTAFTEDRKITAVQAAAAVLQPYHNDLNSFGTITYRIKNNITAQVEGTIMTINVKEGDTVMNGQVLARLRNVQLEIQQEQYENALDSAKAGLFTAQTRMEEARLGIESRLLSLDKSGLKLAQQELELTELYTAAESRRELLAIGGITDAAYRSLELSVSSKEAEIAILRKDIEVSQLGLRDSDLIAAGFTIDSEGAEKVKQFVELNTRTAAADIEAAAANVRNAEKGIDSVRRLVEELSIRSSVAGVVAALYFENGEYIPQNEKIATIMDISRVYAIFYIQEQDISNFTRGAPLRIEIPSLRKNIDAGIDEISPMADPQSGNFSIKAEIPNDDLSIKPGMFIKCVIPRVQDVNYPVIPETALVGADGGEGSVYCIVNGIAVIKAVRVYAQKDGSLWIAAGINEGDMVIDKPSPFLKEGEYVEYR
jgi:RND family efflux transporter MFP subunit